MASATPGVGLAIRLATIQDNAAVWRIYNQGIEDGLTTFATRISPLEEFERWLTSPRVHVLLAESYRQPVGWGSLKPYRDGTAFTGMAEMSVYVDRAWRRHAVGQLLGSALIAEGRSRGLHKLIGYVLERNVSSRKLVEKLGFREVGVHHHHGSRGASSPNVVVVEMLL